MSDDERKEEGYSEIRQKIEEDARRRKERAEEEWREYEAIRQAERERAEEEIKQLRERRERRKKERAEEEARLAEARAIEEQNRRAEEEERLRKRREEEQRKREERERKVAEFAELSKSSNRRNFVITKRASSLEQPDEVKPVEIQKSKEQLEAERRAILEQRIVPLQIDGLKGDALRTKAKELHDLIIKLESENYDLEQRFTRQSYDMQDLSERARNMNKTDKRGTKVQYAPDPLAAKISGIPPKVSMYSEFERVKDRRTFVERKGIFLGPLYTEGYERIEPKVRVVMTANGLQVATGNERPDPPPKEVEEREPEETEEPEEPTKLTPKAVAAK